MGGCPGTPPHIEQVGGAQSGCVHRRTSGGEDPCAALRTGRNAACLPATPKPLLPGYPRLTPAACRSRSSSNGGLKVCADEAAPPGVYKVVGTLTSPQMSSLASLRSQPAYALTAHT